MSINLSDTYVSSSCAVVNAAIAVYMDFATVDSSGSIIGSSPTRLWTGAQDKILTDGFGPGSGSYTAVGGLGNFGNIDETTDLSAKEVDLQLSGIPTEYVSLALQNPYRGRTIVIYLILFSGDYTAFEQTVIFRGMMDQMQLDENGKTSTITLKCQSRLIDIMRFQDLRYTDEAQRTINPTDNGLVFVANLFNQSLYWGNSSPPNLAATPNDPSVGDSPISG